jgi:hypothetical protein
MGQRPAPQAEDHPHLCGIGTLSPKLNPPVEKRR